MVPSASCDAVSDGVDTPILFCRNLRSFRILSRLRDTNESSCSISYGGGGGGGTSNDSNDETCIGL